jgi:transcriptional regulator with XRE-family HTH domain
MSTTSLCVKAYKSNTHAHSYLLCHASGVDGDIKQALGRCQSDLQRTLVRRLKEEMARQAFSQAALARTAQARGHDLTQPTIGRILAGTLDPSLKTVHALADSLGLPDWFLLTDRDQVEERIVRPPKNVVAIPSPYTGVERRQSMKPAKKSRIK